jgi:transcriptional regulator with XRE-family HTH domain
MPTTNLRNALAAEIRARLAVARISGAELARRMSRNQATISRKLTGESGISVGDLEAIAAVLGVTAGEITAAAEGRTENPR